MPTPISFVVTRLVNANAPVTMTKRGYLKRADKRLRDINTVWLLAIIINPFATKLLASSGPETLDTHSLRFGFYALIQVLESAAFFAMLQHIISHQLAPDAPRPAVTDMAWRSGSVMLGFGLCHPQRELTPTVRARPSFSQVPAILGKVTCAAG